MIYIIEFHRVSFIFCTQQPATRNRSVQTANIIILRIRVNWSQAEDRRVWIDGRCRPFSRGEFRCETFFPPPARSLLTRRLTFLHAQELQQASRESAQRSAISILYISRKIHKIRDLNATRLLYQVPDWIKYTHKWTSSLDNDEVGHSNQQYWPAGTSENRQHLLIFLSLGWLSRVNANCK